MANETPQRQTKEGRLSVIGAVLHVSWRTKNNKETTPQPVADKLLSKELRKRKDAALRDLDGQQVHCELSLGNLVKISEGSTILESASGSTASTSKLAPGDAGSKAYSTDHPKDRGRTGTTSQPPHVPPRPCVNEGLHPPKHDPNYRFENPYNFVPALPRDTAKGDLADAAPIGHHRYHPDHWSGRIQVELTTVTPLLIPDNGTEENKHKTFGIRLDRAKRPYLPPTSIKGMLRSAYEAVTNSRMAVFFEQHQEALGFRNPAQSGKGLVPARVSDDGASLELLHGFGDGSQPAAWIPVYKVPPGGGTTISGAEHGKQVWACLEKWLHERKDKKGNWSNFTFWRVREVQDADSPQPTTLPTVSTPSTRKETSNKHSTAIAGVPMKWEKGWIVRNGQNMTNKHDERLFFSHSSHSTTIALDEATRKQWRILMANYRLANKRELDSDTKKPSALKFGVFSRHIISAKERPIDNELAPGTLCYLRINGKTVQRIYPVLISRELYRSPPSELLDESLHPAPAVDKLSPADRVFGWVRTGKGRGTAAYKGQLRIGAVQCDSPDPVETIAPPVPLAILGAPKPAQSRFYVASDDSGDPLPNKIDKDKTYTGTQSLRGRKVYPHHAEAVKCGPSYWLDSGGKIAPVADSLYREWSRPEAKDKEGRCFRTDDQNRSLSAWIRPGTKFTFSIEITNLSDVELGALLWLLSLPEGHHHRLGGGKPLGFGSVRLAATSLDIRKGTAIAADYAGFGRSAQLEGAAPAVDALVGAYKRSCIDSYGQGSGKAETHKKETAVADSPFAALAALKGMVVKAGPGDSDVDREFDQIRFIRSFLNAAKGGDLPVHYPRSAVPPSPQGKNYEWFVANEEADARNALPGLWESQRGLPVLP